MSLSRAQTGLCPVNELKMSLTVCVSLVQSELLSTPKLTVLEGSVEELLVTEPNTEELGHHRVTGIRLGTEQKTNICQYPELSLFLHNDYGLREKGWKYNLPVGCKKSYVNQFVIPSHFFQRLPSKWKPADLSELSDSHHWYFLVWLPLHGPDHVPRGSDWRCSIERWAVPHAEGEAGAEDRQTEDRDTSQDCEGFSWPFPGSVCSCWQSTNSVQLPQQAHTLQGKD